MDWYARPAGVAHQLRVEPRPESWEKADHPDQVRLKAYLDDTEDLLSDSRIDAPWVLRLDVGLSAARDLLDARDLDIYAYPLARRLGDANLVSVWCTKQHGDRSWVGIEPAVGADGPSAELLIARPIPSWETAAYKEQIHSAALKSEELPAGRVRLELSFVVGPGRNWLNLWKPTIDALDPILGRTDPGRSWHPRDGRITELGMHVRVEEGFGHRVVVGIAASVPDAAPERKIAWRTYGSVIAKCELPDGAPTGWGIHFAEWDNEVALSTDQALWLRNALTYVLDDSRINQPTPEPKPLWE